MKLIVNRPLQLAIHADELGTVLATLKRCSVSNDVYGEGDIRTTVIRDQKITVPEDDMAEVLEVFDHGSPVPIMLEYCGYGVTFEVYQKAV